MWLLLHLLIIAGLSARVLLRPHRDPASRVAWILFVVALPYVGALMYLLLGEVRSVNRPVRQTRPDSIQRSLYCIANDSARASAQASSAFAIGESISGFAPVSGNTGRLLSDSSATIREIVVDLDAATDHAHLLFYIWLDDTSGRKVVDALIRAVSRGVTCRVIVDDLGSRSFIRSEQWTKLARAGVQLARAQAVGNVLLRVMRGRIDVRNHRKIVVIDNHITYCGSQNCADAEFAIKAKYAPWVDAVVRLEGPIAQQNQQVFLDDWFNCTGEEVVEPVMQPMPGLKPGFAAQAIATGPYHRCSATPELFATLMFSARRQLVITTPYFVPNETVLAALCAAARRGVATSLVVPARNDSWFVAAASRSYYAELLDAGVSIHEFIGGLLHTKTVTVDGEISLVGSANLDRRSFDLNFENQVLLHDSDLTLAIFRRQQDYIDASKPITRSDTAAWSLQYRLRNSAMAILGPIL